MFRLQTAPSTGNVPTVSPILRTAILSLLAFVQLPRAFAESAQDLPTSLPEAPPEVPITKYLARIAKEGKQPVTPECSEAAAKGVPCFPVVVKEDDRRNALAAARERLEREGMPSGPSGPDPFALPGHGTPAGWGGITFDPVCVAKAIARAVKGETRTYYLYRVRGPGGEWVALREQPMDSTKDQQLRVFEMELLGKFTDECEALKAHARAQREQLERDGATATAPRKSAPAPSIGQRGP